MNKYDRFYPGRVWLDTEGKRIQAHGGSVIFIDGVYYWYGENKEKTVPGSGIWHWGVRCYASRDLYNWEDKGLIILRSRMISILLFIHPDAWTGLILSITEAPENMCAG